MAAGFFPPPQVAGLEKDSGSDSAKALAKVMAMDLATVVVVVMAVVMAVDLVGAQVDSDTLGSSLPLKSHKL